MNLIIEVTRKCNMACEHCLRGEAQCKNIKPEYITTMLESIKKLDLYYSVVFTGGEPSLNIKALQHYIKECKRLKLNHEYFYIATNGHGNNNKDFIISLLELHILSNESSMDRVELSNDAFHDDDNFYTIDLISSLNFYDKKFNEDYHHYKNHSDLIHEGKAWTGRTEKPLSIDSYADFEEFFNDTNVYLNCNGMLINGCDWSYSSQNKKDLQFCHVDNFTTYYMNNTKEACHA